MNRVCSQHSIITFRNQYGIERRANKDCIAAELRTPDTGIIIPEVREVYNKFTINYEAYFLSYYVFDFYGIEYIFLKSNL